MTEVTKDRLDRLPAWARDHIRHVEQERDEARTACDKALGLTDPEKSVALLDPYDEKAIGLGKRPWIGWKINPDPTNPMHCSLTALMRTDSKGRRYLDVNGDGAMHVLPSASNAVKIYVEDR